MLVATTPFLASLAAFTLTYTVVPNVRVRFVHALVGGAVAALLFEFAKQGFVVYLRAFPTYEAIYGAVAVVPIFLLWLYLSWVVVLVGAEVAHGLRLYHWHRPNPRGRELGMLDAVYLLLLLDEAAERGQARSLWDLAAARSDWREDRVEAMLADMLGKGWVQQTRNGDWLLARRASDLTLYEILSEGGYPLPDGEQLAAADERLGSLFHQVHAEVKSLLDVPLARFRLRRAEAASLNPVASAQ
ncbi:MAG: YihY family inner membrane protein [Gammaproteobacteria bacterium]|nr:MAG: YihY family inner membrane protein [Gammaproteobacteria bacterium]